MNLLCNTKNIQCLHNKHMMDSPEHFDVVEFEGELEYDDDELLAEMETIVSDLFVFYEQWIEARNKSIQEIRKMACDLHACQKNIDITKAIGACIGAAATLAGAFFTGIGIALRPCSCRNRSSQFMKLGLGAGVLGGAGVSTSLVATAVKNVTERHKWKRFKEIIEADSVTTESLKSVITKYNKTLKSLQNIISEKEASSLLRHIVQAARGTNRIATRISKVLKVGLKTKMASLILPSTRAALKASRILSAISIILGGISLILDIIYLVQVSIHIHDGSRSDVAKKLEEIADVMEEELMTVKTYVLQISQDADAEFDEDFHSDDGFIDSLINEEIWSDSQDVTRNTADVISWLHDVDQEADDTIAERADYEQDMLYTDIHLKKYETVNRELYRLTPEKLLDVENCEVL